MPYDNVPRHLWPKMERCVAAVLTPDFIKSNGGTKGTAKPRAIAVCYKRVVGDVMMELVMKETVKADLDALQYAKFPKDGQVSKAIARVLIPESSGAQAASKFLVKNKMKASMSGIVEIQDKPYMVFPQVERENIVKAGIADKVDGALVTLSQRKGVLAVVAQIDLKNISG